MIFMETKIFLKRDSGSYNVNVTTLKANPKIILANIIS